MKKILICLFATLLTVTGYSQSRIANVAPCASDKLFEKSIKENPGILYQLEELEKQYKKETDKLKQRRSGPQMITIPVVFYVVSPGSTDVSNIPDSQINAQLATLNSYFAPLNIQFCVATKVGNNTSLPLAAGTSLPVPNSGIVRVYKPSIAVHNISTASQQALIGNSVHYQISAEKFLRIWIVKDIQENNVSTGILGYSPVPLTSSVLDGVVIKYNVVGGASNCTNCLTNYNQGKTLVHEVGHYLNLFHTFHQGCLGSGATCGDEGDKVCDTPQSNNPIANCNAIVNSCPENPDNDDLTNFMGYAYDPCKTGFTPGQGIRMNAVINSFRPMLVSVDNLVDVGACSGNLVSSAITATAYQVCVNNPITFSSPYNDTNIHGYSWDFGDPGNPGNTAATPSAAHTYPSAVNSPYTVTLTVTRLSDGVTSTSTRKVFVTACQGIVNSQGTWIVAGSNRLSFSSGIPVFDQFYPLNIPMYYNSSVQNDNSGNLLFYTNKTDVFNSNYTAINTGGTTIANDSWGGRSGSTMIVPKPNNPNKYYLFSNTIKTPSQTFDNSHGFRFSEIQVNSGAAVMNSIRQPIMDASVSSFFEVQQGALYNGEGITAVKRRASLTDEAYWIITCLRGVNGKTYVVVFLFGNGGTITYQSHFESPLNYSNNLLTIKAAPNGNKLFMFNAGYSANAYIMDFNKVTGVVSDAKVVTYNITGGLNEGASFSPDSNLLYFTEAQRNVSQINVNAMNPGQTKVMVVQESYPGVMSQMQLGPDGKIYISGPYSEYLKVIHNPNNLCTQTNYNNCNYYYFGPKVTNPGAAIGFALPNNIDAQQSTAYTNNNTSISSYITGCNTYKFFPDYYGSSFSWDFGDPASGSNNTSTASNPTHTFAVGTNPQYTFTVSLKNSSGTVIAQKQVIIINPVYTITGSTLACSSSENNSTNNYINISDGDSVVWSITGGGVGGILGNNLPNVQVNWTTLPGTLTATVTTKSGCTKTVSVTINQLCCQENIVLNAVESGTNTVYNANNSVTTETNYTLNSGVTTTLKSGVTIALKPNTHIKKGSAFLAILETCEGNQLVNKSAAMVEVIEQPRKNENYSRELHDESTAEEGINEAARNVITMYPNPSNNMVTISSTSDTIKRLSIVSIDGKEVLNQITDGTSYQLNVSNFSRGIYIVSIETEKGEIISKKLIKN
ncbi:M43 family zinc metalloprotease [Flavobacterium sp.]|uniref:M43 family zinc metalloprotease n=1 Tax=Flavobacterium sp. TaxID=239 RepID=UPI002635C9C4|nr:M43 family zinc metalloprotease [Flavobacterium sp.]